MADDFMTGFLAGEGNNNGGFGGFGGEGLWAVIILAIIFGWGRGGNFGGGSGGGDVYYGGGFEGAIQRGFDTNSIINKLNGLENGLCDGFYAQNTNMLTGFSGVQNTLAQGFAGINTALVTQGYETRMNDQATQTQLASCCCDIKSAIGDIKYQMATNACAVGNQISTATRDIIDSQAAGTRAILDELCNMRIQAKDERIAEQAQRIASLELAASQAAQNNYLVNTITQQIAPRPIPAFQVAAPWQYGSSCGNSCC